MQSRSDSVAQAQFPMHDLLTMLNARQPLYRLAQTIDWKQFEAAFDTLYADEGRPALPIRRIAHKSGIPLRQSYARTMPKLLQAQRGWLHPRIRTRADSRPSPAGLCADWSANSRPITATERSSRCAGACSPKSATTRTRFTRGMSRRSTAWPKAGRTRNTSLARRLRSSWARRMASSWVRSIWNRTPAPIQADERALQDWASGCLS